jgi:hypothetical protein
MKRSQAEAVLETLVEDLAAIEHERWVHWQHYMHDKGERRPDGSLVLPAELVRQWDRQIVTGYADLSESEKVSDREQVRRYLPLIAAALSERGSRG